VMQVRINFAICRSKHDKHN